MAAFFVTHKSKNIVVLLLLQHAKALHFLRYFSLLLGNFFVIIRLFCWLVLT